MKTGNVILAVVIWMIGGLVSFFFGLPAVVMDMQETCILALLIYLISLIIGVIVIYKGRETTSQASAQTSSKPMRHCPKCGRQIPFDAVICPYCQYDFK